MCDIVALQDAERANYVVEKAVQEKRSLIIKAEGEAKAAMMIADAIKGNPGYLELKRVCVKCSGHVTHPTARGYEGDRAHCLTLTESRVP